MDSGQRAAALAHRSANRVDDDGVPHAPLPFCRDRTATALPRMKHSRSRRGKDRVRNAGIGEINAPSA
ncbi:hypothetical protein GCM10009533_12710 [Saccharopolyspora spinosporotrichia]|uniref:Uncharacterized protein n=1 Tax=Saccharopolyspora erythraea TaxID=1836 RepID=A0ABP3MBK5_SACER